MTDLYRKLNLDFNLCASHFGLGKMLCGRYPSVFHQYDSSIIVMDFEHFRSHLYVEKIMDDGLK